MTQFPRYPEGIDVMRLFRVLELAEMGEQAGESLAVERQYAIETDRLSSDGRRIRAVGRASLKAIRSAIAQRRADREADAAAVRAIERIASSRGTTLQAVRNFHCRVVRLVAVRNEIVLELRDQLGMSYPQIARVMGMSDHTTALLAYRRAKAGNWRRHRNETRERADRAV